MSTTITLFGAGGTMGCRILDNALDRTGYEFRPVEPGEQGRERLAERGLDPVAREEAVDGTDVVVLAVPDRVIGDLCREIVDDLPDGTLVLALDPAAAHAGELPERDGVSYVVTHPCHPPLFDEGREGSAENDWFGGQGEAEQPICCALHRGSEADYRLGERIARDAFAPVSRVHRVTVAGMALLEPALVENLLTTFLLALREGLDDVTARGVDEDAARDMLFGHLRTQVAMFFGDLDHPLSEGAERAVEQGREQVLREDWRGILDPETVERNAREIATLEVASE